MLSSFSSPETTFGVITSYQMDKWQQQPLNWTDDWENTTTKFPKHSSYNGKFWRNAALFALEINFIPFQPQKNVAGVK
jgi:hypothetical protein